MNSNNNFKKYFSSLKYLLAIIGVIGVFLSCSNPSSPSPINSNEEDNSSTTLRVTYTNASGLQTPNPNSENTFTLQFNSTNERNTGTSVTLTVPEGASLSNSSGPLTLTVNSLVTNLSFNNSSAFYNFTVIANDGVTTKTYTIKSTIVNATSRQILSFTLRATDNGELLNGDVSAAVNEQDKTITLSLTNIPNTFFIPTIDFAGSNVSPESGKVQDFSSNNIYVVTAHNDTTATYTVTLNRYYDVTFDANGGSFADGESIVTNVAHGSVVTAPADPPVRDYFGFNGWYTAKTGGSEFNFTNTPITQPTTNYAQWTKETTFASIVFSGEIPASLNDYDELSKTIFSNYTAEAKVTALYVTTNGSGDGTSWSNATNSLQGAINGISGANANNIYVVLVASGTYMPSTTSYSMKNYVAIIGGFTVDSYERSGETRLDGNGGRSVFHHNNLEVTNSAILYGVTITNGSANQGGGMYNQNSSPTLMEVTFSVNTATGTDAGGGGMYNTGSSPTLINVTFSDNRTTNSGGRTTGGGMYNDGSSPTLTEVTFSGNRSDSGGGMYNTGSSPTLIGVTFSGNTANAGGGMFNFKSSSPTLTEVTFSRNKANGSGGGMYNDGSSPTLTKVTFSSNTAGDTGSGGGMYNQESSSPTLIGVTFSDNTANTGGGMYNINNSFSTLINVTFSGNMATYHGGGMYNVNKSFFTMINVTFSGNMANQDGGGIWGQNGSFSTMINVTFFDNTAGVNGGGIRVSGSLYTMINTLMWESSFAGFGHKIRYSLIQGDTPNPATGVITDDPGQLTFGNHGGAVNTVSISETSSAKNAGAYVRGVKENNAYSISNVYYSTNYSTNTTTWYRASDDQPQPVGLPENTEDLTPTTDARGYTRVERPDIGAYEVGGTAP